MNLINLTPHELNILDANNNIIDIPASGTIARCSQDQEIIGNINGFEITHQVFGEVVDLPEPAEDTIYIVSRLVAEAARNRRDLLIPGPLLRDADGTVIGCRGLSVL